MSAEGIPTKVVLVPSLKSLGIFIWDWQPHPGSHIELDGESYLVLERRHRYHLKLNRYEINQVLLSVQQIQSPSDRTYYEGQWGIGDVSCQYNARSPLIRCAVNPEGPCDRCPEYRQHC